jgi:FkbH-like protein
MKYTDILKRNKELEQELTSEKYKIALISNITITQLKEVLELSLREIGINAEVTLSDYDAIVQESHRFSNFNAVVFFWELINLVDGLQSKIYLMDQDEINRLANKVESEIDIVLRNTKNVPLVIINQFSASLIDNSPLKQGPLNILGDHLNKVLRSKVISSQVILDINSIFSNIGIDKSRDLRQFHTSKTLYSIDFFRKYSKTILPAFLAVNGKTKKILVLDCDNTLWDGIIGEDGESGIQMSDVTAKGKIFKEVQTILLGMQKEGILLALCSKNNEEDVNKIFKNHPDILIKDNHIVSKKINWQDKVKKITEIAEELNLGLDSFVFIDDSNFEVGLVRKELPMVETIQVPANLTEYPILVKELKMLFFSLSKTNEDKNKTAMYLEERQRKEQLKIHDSIDNYLSSLGLSLSIHWNQEISVSRAAQLTQKTNQFNLTTRRYTESDIIRMLEDPEYVIAVFSVSDQFGDYGVTGMSIIQIKNSTARIDSLLMSCRVIGRHVELAFFDQLVKILLEKKIKTILGSYISTAKNKQVEAFYDGLGFTLTISKEHQKDYTIQLENYKMNNLPYIKINQSS